MAKLGDVCTINPRSPSVEDDLSVSFVPMPKVGENGEFDATEIRPYREVKKGYTGFQNGDVLFAKITPCMENGKGAIAHDLENGIGFGSTEFHVLRPDTDKISSEWLYYLLRWPFFRKKAEMNMTGSGGQRRVPKEFLERYQLNIPDLYTQEKQSDTLDKISSLISLRKQQLEKLDELVKARFVEMFGDENSVHCWPQCQIGDVADVCVGVVIKPTQYYTENGIPAFRSLNIGEMKVKNSDWVMFTEEGHKKNQKSIVRENDVLVVRSGAPGTACVVGKEYAGYNAVDIIIAHPNLSKVNPVFLAEFTNMPHGMKQIREKTGGAAQQHFNVGGYKSLRLILPPMEIQEQFALFFYGNYSAPPRKKRGF